MSHRAYQFILINVLSLSLISALAGLLWFLYLIGGNVIVLSPLIISLILGFAILCLVLKDYVLSNNQLAVSQNRLLRYVNLRALGLGLNAAVLFDIYQKFLPFDNRITVVWLVADFIYLVVITMILRPVDEPALKLTVLLGILLLVLTLLFVYRPEYSPMRYHSPNQAKPQHIEPSFYRVSY
jgi:hypothetical protein